MTDDYLDAQLRYEHLVRQIDLYLPDDAKAHLHQLLDRRGAFGTCDQCGDRYVGHVLGSQLMQGPVARAMRALREAKETESRPAPPILVNWDGRERDYVPCDLPERMEINKRDYFEMQRAYKLIPLMERAIEDLMNAVYAARQAMIDHYLDLKPVPQPEDKKFD